MFKGRLVIVTGGAGALGSAVVKALLDADASVFVPYQHEGELDRLRGHVGETSVAALSGQVLNLSDEAAVIACYTRVAQSLGAPVGLVNIAGGFDGGSPIHETPWSLWQQQLDINVKTTVLSCRAAIPHMLEEGGAIVNVSSRTATQSGKNVAAYAAAKRAVLQLTETLAAELLSHDIRANSILPSVIDTPTNRASNPNVDHTNWVKPEAIARVILFLLGPDSAVISGAAIPVYGKA